MKIVPNPQTREQYTEILDDVFIRREEIVIERGEGRSVVIVPLEDYMSLRELVDPLKQPMNPQRLLRSIAELEAGRGVQRDLLDPDAPAQRHRNPRGE
jgi:antitoxin YefM